MISNKLIKMLIVQSGETSATATPDDSQCSAGRIEEEVEGVNSDDVDKAPSSSTLDSPPTSPLYEHPRFRHYIKSSDPIPIG